MTRGISEETLINTLQKHCLSPLHETILKQLISECDELNPWLPIDEDTPRDEPILLFYPDGVSADRNVLIGYATEHNGMSNKERPTRWKKLPEDPK